MIFRHKVLFILIGLSLQLFANPKLLVLDFKNNGPKTQQHLQAGVADMLALSLENSQYVEIIQRSQFESLAKGKRIRPWELQDPTVATKFGQELDAKWVVTGTMTNLGKSIRLDVRLIKTENAQVVPNGKISVKAITEENLDAAVEEVAQEILKLLPDSRREERREDRLENRKDQVDDRREYRKEDRRGDRKDRRDERRDERLENKRNESPEVIRPEPLVQSNGFLDLQVDSDRIFSVRIDGKDNVPDINTWRVLVELTPGNHQIIIYQDVMPMREVYNSSISIPSGTTVKAKWERNRFRMDPVATIAAPPPPQPAQATPPSTLDEPESMHSQTYADLITALNDERFEDGKIAILKSTLKRNYLSTDQLIEILDLFSHENNRLDVAKLSYPRLIDKTQVNRILKSFRFSATKKDFLNWVDKQ